MRTVSIYCKVIFTTRHVRYNIPAVVTVRAMMDRIKQCVSQDFQMHNIELVEAGQPFGIAEHAPALLPEDISLKEKFGDRLDYLALYIRPLVTSSNAESPQCVICHDEENIITSCYYDCRHRLCDNCIVQSVRHHLLRCSICRCTQRNNNNNNDRVMG